MSLWLAGTDRGNMPAEVSRDWWPWSGYFLILLLGEGENLPRAIRASSAEGWQWDIDTDAQGWKFIVTRSVTARTKPNAEAHVGCSFSCETSGKRRRQKNKISIVRASAHVSAYCLALAFVCLSAQTPNTERDRLPPDSYLLVLVSLCSD